MELRTALAQRGPHVLGIKAPFRWRGWEDELCRAGLLGQYEDVPRGMREGFRFGYPDVESTQAPPNGSSAEEFGDVFRAIIENEVAKGRYIGPFTRRQLEQVLGSFQTSPFTIIPKAGRPGKFRLIQNLSFPCQPSHKFPNKSINSQIDSDDFPCTWATFATICQIITRLPPGSQAAVRDVSEAYRTIPLHPSQWHAGAVRTGEDEFHVDRCLCFGSGPAAGGYGHVGDCFCDIMRARGMLPISKWVDDNIMFRILRVYMEEYNRKRQECKNEVDKRGKLQRGGRIWFGGRILEDGTLEEYDEDCKFPCKDLSGSSRRSEEDQKFTYNMDDVDRLSDKLGIPWEKSKDSPFSSTAVYIGFLWDLDARTVALGPGKATKYIASILAWEARSTHTLTDIQELYGKLLHACHVLPAGRAWITGLEDMLSIPPGRDSREFVPRHATRTIKIELRWWTARLEKPTLSRPIPHPVALLDTGAFADASSGIGIAIVIGKRWRAWRLIPGWKTLNGTRDIGWAEAVAFELLVRAVVRERQHDKHYKVYGDNKGVVEGWWNGRSRNTEVNIVFRRVHAFLESQNATDAIRSAYVTSANNPADAPSRGIYASKALLLPTIELDPSLERFLISSTEDYSPTEHRLLQEGRYPKAIKHNIEQAMHKQRWREWLDEGRILEESRGSRITSRRMAKWSTSV